MLQQQKCSLQDFKRICKQTLKKEDYPLSCLIKKNIVIYDGNKLRKSLSKKKRVFYEIEFSKVFEEGSGIVVIQNFFDNKNIIDKMNTVFNTILKEEKN